MELRTVRRSRIAVSGFAALSAVAGSVMVISGWPYAFPLSWLRGTPFGSYVVPGLILGVVVGGSATLAMVAALRNTNDGPGLSVLAGFVMMGWVVGEIALLHATMGGFTPLWPLYFGVGLAMTVLGLIAARGSTGRVGHRVRPA